MSEIAYNAGNAVLQAPRALTTANLSRGQPMANSYHKSPKAHLRQFQIQPTHGRSRTRTYFIWKGMIARCGANAKPRDRLAYGARGITVCERWHSFENFHADMGEAPTGLSIDRLDNDGPYCKDNCAWRTPIEQARNKRTSVWLTHNEETLTLKEWSERIGLPYTALKARKRYGWSVERMLTEPLH